MEQESPFAIYPLLKSSYSVHQHVEQGSIEINSNVFIIINKIFINKAILISFLRTLNNSLDSFTSLDITQHTVCIDMSRQCY
jgi:hypothetical protein